MRAQLLRQRELGEEPVGTIQFVVEHVAVIAADRERRVSCRVSTSFVSADFLKAPSETKFAAAVTFWRVNRLGAGHEGLGVAFHAALRLAADQKTFRRGREFIPVVPVRLSNWNVLKGLLVEQLAAGRWLLDWRVKGVFC